MIYCCYRQGNDGQQLLTEGQVRAEKTAYCNTCPIVCVSTWSWLLRLEVVFIRNHVANERRMQVCLFSLFHG